MKINFTGKRALVTGASTGFGREIAKKLAAGGAEVVAVGLGQNDLDSLKSEVPSIETVLVDLLDWNATEAALRNIGPIDLLVNNAGIGLLKPLTELTEEDVDKVLGVNLKAVINVTQIVVKDLLARKASGAIVSVSSIGSLAGLLGHSVYCASKGGIDAFSRAAALELGPHNIRVNFVNPTAVMTEMGKYLEWANPKLSKPLIDRTPLGRFGEIHEIADAVLFLLSDRASMITGSSLPVDGGYLAC